MIAGNPCSRNDQWSEAARRQLLAEIVPLYRLRGTVGALSRYLETGTPRPTPRRPGFDTER